ncbi:hypothetical protein FXO38_33616 [Capsicum annuum]|uniref:Transcription repressor n=1 Tax=Capsicum annuum TaxID=4072 RepID=A0A2G2YN38_CAPAN|nr:hypothetical protein FXO38_33616 [Capsicum annuum]KAF3684430.1 hypothetical protein FXO37_01328 [Capsicum annuum]PHT71150.1 hypothetical protein T459_26254 [Capsicum annuum]
MEKSSSILEVSSSKNNGGNNTFEFQPFSDSSCVTMTMMNSIDPFGNFKKSMGIMVEANQGIETSSILEVGSSSKSDNCSNKNSKKSVNDIVESNQEPKTSSLLEVSSKGDGLDFIPFNDSPVIA